MHESCKNKCFVCIAGRQGTLRAAAAEMECIVMIKHPPLRLHLIVPLWKLSSNTSCAERVIQTEDPTTENTDAVSKCIAFLCIHTTVFPSWLLSLSYELPLLGPLNEDVRLYSLFIWLLNAAPSPPITASLTACLTLASAHQSFHFYRKQHHSNYIVSAVDKTHPVLFCF